MFKNVGFNEILSLCSVCVSAREPEGASHTRAASGSLRNTGTVMCGPLQPCNSTALLLFLWFISLLSSYPAMTLWIPTKREKYGVGEWLSTRFCYFLINVSLWKLALEFEERSAAPLPEHTRASDTCVKSCQVITHKLLRWFNIAKGFRFVDISLQKIGWVSHRTLGSQTTCLF